MVSIPKPVSDHSLSIATIKTDECSGSALYEYMPMQVVNDTNLERITIHFAFKIDKCPDDRAQTNGIYMNKIYGYNGSDSAVMQLFVRIDFKNSTGKANANVEIYEYGVGWQSGTPAEINIGDWYYVVIDVLGIGDTPAMSTYVYMGIFGNYDRTGLIVSKNYTFVSDVQVEKVWGTTSVYWPFINEEEVIEWMFGPIVIRVSDETTSTSDSIIIRATSGFEYLTLDENSDAGLNVLDTRYTINDIELEDIYVDDDSLSGSNTDQSGFDGGSTTGSFSDLIYTELSTLASNIDQTLTLPEFDIYIGGLLQPVADMLNVLGNSILIPGFEFATDSILEVIKYLVINVASISDIIIDNASTFVEDSADDFLNWCKTILNIKVKSGSTYWQIGANLQKMVDGVDDWMVDEFGAEEAEDMWDKLKFKRSRIFPKEILTGGGCSDIRIPNQFEIDLFSGSFTYNFSLEDIILAMWGLFPGMSDIKIPMSEYFPFDLSDPTERERHVTYSGNGVTARELVLDYYELVAYALAFYVVAKFVPWSVLYKIMFKMLGLNRLQPSNKDIVRLMGVPYKGISNPVQYYHPSGNDLWQELNEEINGNQTDISNLQSDVSDIKGEMSAIIPERLKYIVNEIKGMIDGIGEQDIGEQILAIQSAVATLNQTASTIETIVKALEASPY